MHKRWTCCRECLITPQATKGIAELLGYRNSSTGNWSYMASKRGSNTSVSRSRVPNLFGSNNV